MSIADELIECVKDGPGSVTPDLLERSAARIRELEKMVNDAAGGCKVNDAEAKIRERREREIEQDMLIEYTGHDIDELIAVIDLLRQAAVKP